MPNRGSGRRSLLSVLVALAVVITTWGSSAPPASAEQVVPYDTPRVADSPPPIASGSATSSPKTGARTAVATADGVWTPAWVRTSWTQTGSNKGVIRLEFSEPMPQNPPGPIDYYVQFWRDYDGDNVGPAEMGPCFEGRVCELANSQWGMDAVASNVHWYWQLCDFLSSTPDNALQSIPHYVPLAGPKTQEIKSGCNGHCFSVQPSAGDPVNLVSGE